MTAPTLPPGRPRIDAMARRRFASIVAVTLALTVAGSACGGGSGSSAAKHAATTPPTRLTAAQAFTLAQAQLLDHRGGGAHFVASLPARGQVVATLSGDIDWVGQLGLATYTPVGGTAPTPATPTRYEWSPSIVLVGGIPGLEQAMAEQGRDGITWVSRPLDPTTTPLDGVLALVFTLASPQADNPQLLAQSSARYLGRRTRDGARVDVFTYGTNTTYFIGVADGRIHEVEATFRSFPNPIVVRLGAFHHRTLSQPQRNAVVDASTIPDLYQRLTGHAAPTASAPPPDQGTSTTTP